MKPDDLFDLRECEHAAVFQGLEYVWDALKRLPEYLIRLLSGIDDPSSANATQGEFTIAGRVHIGKNTVIEPGAYIAGPTYIGDHCEIRHNAYIRGNVLIGNHCVIGNSSELKGAICLDSSAAPHFAYVGDSILGRRVNLGAGTRLSNLPISSEKRGRNGRPSIRIPSAKGPIDTHMEKFGAILGDDVQTGCNSVLNPGTIVGPGTWIYPGVSLAKGIYPAQSVIKLRQQLEVIEKRRQSLG